MVAATFKPVLLTSKRIANDIVSVRLPSDLIDPFYKMCKDSGLSPSKLGAQCIRFALDHSEEQ